MHAHPQPSRRAGILKGLLLALLLCLAAAAVVWALLLPNIAASIIRSRTGFSARIEQLTINPFTANVELHGLLLRNPDGCPLEDFVEVREFRADAELFSLFGDRIVADEVVLDVPKLTLVRDEQGRLNATVFKDGLLRSSQGTAGEPASSSPEKAFLIRHLVVKFDKLVYADFSGKKTGVKEYNLHLDRDVRDVTSPLQLLNPLAGAFSSAGMASDTLGSIFKNGGNVLKTTGGALENAGRKTGETIRDALDSLEKKTRKK